MKYHHPQETSLHLLKNQIQIQQPKHMKHKISNGVNAPMQPQAH